MIHPRYIFLLTSRLAGCVALFCGAFVFLGTHAVQAQSATNAPGLPVKHVLMLFSEGRESPAGLLLEQAIQSEMQRHSSNNLEFFIERMDANQFPDEAHQHLFQDYLGKKYATRPLDLILAVPFRDYTLAGELPDSLFPDVPVVFVTVNELEVPTGLSKLGVTGIIQRFDLQGTLALILKLQPDTRHVVVIGGTSGGDRATLGRIAAVAKTVEGVDFSFWTNQPATTLPNAVSHLPEDTVILLSTMQRDAAGQQYFGPEMAQMLLPTANVPVYVLGSSSIGTGAVGGAVVDPTDLGTRTAQLASLVLHGANPESVPIEVDTKGTQMVDWHALQRWHISPSRVPADCSIRFRPVTLWEEHRLIILIFLAVFILQALTIAALLAQRRQRRQAEITVLNQRNDLAHASRVSTMGQLASSLAHELNQPLGAILRNAEAAELFLQKEKPDLEEIRAILADIRKDDERAGNVINRMRSLLRRQSLESDPLDLHGLIDETVTLARSDAAKRRIHLSTRIAPDLPLVLGDRVHLQQVLLNLMLNGMDAMANCLPVDRLLSVQANKVNGNVEVSVRDHGSGIPADKLERVFEPFFSTKSEGMGMGLAISRTIIEAHGGKIRAENNPDKGASFIFTLKPAD